MWSASLQSSSFPVPFQGLIKVDGITGATSLVKKVGSVYSNIAYDPYRDRLAMSMELTFTPYENGFYLCDAAGLSPRFRSRSSRGASFRRAMAIFT